MLNEKDLTEPLSSYVSSTYNTLCSVVQGIALGALFYVGSELTKSGGWTWPVSFQCIVILSLCALLWHRYVVNNQFATWRLEWQDTAIPILFAALQIGLALVVSLSTIWFSGILTIISILGVCAYWNAIWRYSKPQSLKLFEEHFERETKEFSSELHEAINRFHRISRILMWVSTVVMGGITVNNIMFDCLSEDAKSIATSVIAEVIILSSYYFDLRWYLNNRTVHNIRQYWW